MSETEQTSPWTGRLDTERRPAKEPKPTPPGWYQTEGTLRYFDGTNWTEHVAPPYPVSLKISGMAQGVAIGVFLALFLVWAGAQIAPDHIYFPVKFVTDEPLPGFGAAGRELSALR